MDCPRCGGETRVIKTERIGTVVERLRECQACRHYFKTEESVSQPVKFTPAMREAVLARKRGIPLKLFPEEK